MPDPVRVAIITGASSGIGRESAVALSAAGWHVTLTARRHDQLEETARMCSGETQIVSGDIASEAHVLHLFQETLSRFGRLDLLFNNAGIGAPQVPMEELDLAKFQAVINVNLTAAWLCTREAFKIFKSQSPSGGRIINNGSISAHTPRPHTSPYTTSKHALTGLTKSTALDGRAFGIACTQIDIGNALTELALPLASATLQADGSIRGEATFDPKYVASSVVYIASLPTDVSVLEMNIMATKMPFVGRG